MAARKQPGGAAEQVELLRHIWNEMKGLRASFDSQLEATRSELGSRIDETNARLDAVRTELKEEIGTLRSELKEEIGALRSRVVESEVRLGSATLELATDVHRLSGIIQDWRAEHRSDREELRGRVERIEKRLALEPPSR